MVKCQNEEYVAIITGKRLVMNEFKPNQLYVITREPTDENKRGFKFVTSYHIKIKDIDIFNQ